MDTLLGILQPGDDAVVRATGRAVALVERVRNQPWVWLVEYPSGARRRFRAWELEGIRVAEPPEDEESGLLVIDGLVRCSSDVRSRAIRVPFGVAASAGIRGRYARWLDAEGDEKEDIMWELVAIWEDLFTDETGQLCQFQEVDNIWLE